MKLSKDAKTDASYPAYPINSPGAFGSGMLKLKSDKRLFSLRSVLCNINIFDEYNDIYEKWATREVNRSLSALFGKNCTTFPLLHFTFGHTFEKETTGISKQL